MKMVELSTKYRIQLIFMAKDLIFSIRTVSTQEFDFKICPGIDKTTIRDTVLAKGGKFLCQLLL